MKTGFLFKLLILVTAIFAVSAQQPVDPLASPVSTENALIQQLTGVSKKISAYNSYIQAMIRNAKKEMANNHSERPSTTYTIDDIVFTVTKKLPSWVFPVSTWKQDSITRRRQIAKIIHSSVNARPYAITVRDDTVDWVGFTQKALDRYFEDTRLNAKAIYDASQEYLSMTQFADSNISVANAKRLQETINDFFILNSYNFSTIMEEVNSKFDTAVNMAGSLRVPMESIRYDVIQTITEARNNFIRPLQHRLDRLVEHADHELKDDNVSADLKEYIVHSAKEELGPFSDIVTEFSRLKYITANVLKTAASEFKQTPSQLNYWVDVLAEIKAADWSFEGFSKNFQTEKKPCCRK